MRSALTFEIEDISLFKLQLLQWANQFSKVSYLNSNSEPNSVSQKPQYSNFDLLVAADSIDELDLKEDNAFEKLKAFYESKNDWLFGYFSYDLKNEIEKLVSTNEDNLGNSLLHFFQPRYVFILKSNKLTIEYLSSYFSKSDIEQLLGQISSTILSKRIVKTEQPVIHTKVNKAKYIDRVNQIKNHLQRGDIYELNYCVEFFLKDFDMLPFQLYSELNSISKTPFSCFYKSNFNYLICSSPERFLKKIDTKLISQPIKGTRKRGSNTDEDELLKIDLLHDEKERNENVMIVDLVRNDLSRSAKRGTVKVEELFGVYSFKQVHQLISTITCQLREDIHFIDSIKNAFPMGSMTGAPKVRAMELIENFEDSKRGLYSGAVGYISPTADFDFNVVIRSILYNEKNKYCSFSVGSAITSNAKAETEYEECLLKAQAMIQVLNGKLE